MLIFAKAAFSAGIVFGLAEDGAYQEMIPYGIPSLILFGAGAPLAAYLADKWNRNGMLAVFFVGIGVAAIGTSFAQSPLQIGIGLAFIGLFAAIYHPVGIAMVIQGGGKVGFRLGANGVWGNMGIAAAPLITGFILASYDWRLAFVIPGLISILIGIGFISFSKRGHASPPEASAAEKAMIGLAPGWQRAMLALVLIASGGGFVFGTVSFIIPRMFEVSLPGVSTDVAVTGTYASIVFAIAAFAQLIVGRAIDRRDIKLVLITLALGQPLLLGLMSMQTNYLLIIATVIALGFVFGQIPITDAIVSRYVPDIWRTKVLSVKLVLNLVIGALALMAARAILNAGQGFEGVMIVAAMTASFIFLGSLLLPSQMTNPATAAAE
jgi:MFS family permease